MDQGAFTLVVDLAKAFSRVQFLETCMGLGDALWLPAANSSSTFVGTLSISEGCFAKNVWQTRCTTILPDSKWSVSPLRIVMQEAMSEVLKVYPQCKLKVQWMI